MHETAHKPKRRRYQFADRAAAEDAYRNVSHERGLYAAALTLSMRNAPHVEFKRGMFTAQVFHRNHSSILILTEQTSTHLSASAHCADSWVYDQQKHYAMLGYVSADDLDGLAFRDLAKDVEIELNRHHAAQCAR